MKKLTIATVLVAGTMTLTGCVGSIVQGVGAAVKFARTDTELCERLEIGKTNEAEVRAMFGAPDTSVPLKTGEKMKKYSRGNVKVDLLFDKSGVLTEVKQCGVPETDEPPRVVNPLAFEQR
ncbi:hypothetical protein [Geobacter sp.]|uniref:hypothetical protein n=1 Tax=Geobacter sp. TaxID=46610 RepID=UPI0027BAC50D|nr:hypothetical protein [Geobacter sp.]